MSRVGCGCGLSWSTPEPFDGTWHPVLNRCDWLDWSLRHTGPVIPLSRIRDGY